MRTILSILLALFAGAAASTELTFHASAFDAALKRELFMNDGRYVMSGAPDGCAFAYLESPSSTIRDGRIFIRARFSGRAGANVGGSCVGTGDTFWVTLSAQPAARGDLLVLEQIRVDEAKDVFRGLFERLLARRKKPLALNLRKEFERALTRPDAPFEMELVDLKIKRVVTQNDRLQIALDLAIVAK
jgi:hypothetical protein